MKKVVLVSILLILFGRLSYAQQQEHISGSYFLDGVKDTHSGFRLKSNYTFTFFFTYGGLDRYGSGSWTREKNTIVFNSRVKPARDFKLLTSRRVNDNYVTIRFEDDNPGLTQKIEVILYTERGRQKLFTGKEGIVKFPKNVVDSIQVFPPLFPDHSFTYIVTNKIQNYFEFAFEKWIREVFFDDFPLVFSNNMLIGSHPLLTGRQYRYVKQEVD